jgi:hypothetical protein
VLHVIDQAMGLPRKCLLPTLSSSPQECSGAFVQQSHVDGLRFIASDLPHPPQ